MCRRAYESWKLGVESCHKIPRFVCQRSWRRFSSYRHVVRLSFFQSRRGRFYAGIWLCAKFSIFEFYGYFMYNWYHRTIFSRVSSIHAVDFLNRCLPPNKLFLGSLLGSKFPIANLLLSSFINTMTIADLPQLPLVCLKTADFLDTKEVVKGKNTIIGTFSFLQCFFKFFSCRHSHLMICFAIFIFR